jgi:hypothetical protein
LSELAMASFEMEERGKVKGAINYDRSVASGSYAI